MRLCRNTIDCDRHRVAVWQRSQGRTVACFGWALALGLFGCQPRDEHSRPGATALPEQRLATPLSTATSSHESSGSTATTADDGLFVAGPIRYLERFSGGAQPDERVPIIVGIHGLGDTPEGFANLLLDLPIRARLIFPRGLDDYDGSFGSGWSWFPARARDNDLPRLAQGISRASSAIAAGIAHLLATLPKSHDRVIVTGFSQGGMLTYALAAQHPELVHTAIPIAGLLPPELWPEKPSKSSVHLFAIHGDADKTVRLEPARATVETLRQRGFDAQMRVFAGKGHQVSPEMRATLFELINDAAKSPGSTQAAKSKAPAP